MTKRGGRPRQGKAGSKAGPAFNDALTLAALGIDTKLSSRAQKRCYRMKLEGSRVSRERHRIGYMPAAALSSTSAATTNIPPIPRTMPRAARYLLARLSPPSGLTGARQIHTKPSFPIFHIGTS